MSDKSQMDRDIAAVARAYRGFKKGQRVRHSRGWVGTVSGEPSERCIVWCLFDGMGPFGANPLNLTKLPDQGPTS